MKAALVACGIALILAGWFVAWPDAGVLFQDDAARRAAAIESRLDSLRAARTSDSPTAGSAASISEQQARRSLGFGVAIAVGGVLCFAAAARATKRRESTEAGAAFSAIYRDDGEWAWRLAWRTPAGEEGGADACAGRSASRDGAVAESRAAASRLGLRQSGEASEFGGDTFRRASQ